MTEEYAEYAGVFSTAMLATATSYLIDIREPASFLLLALVPLSLSFTAYISRNGFRKASLSSLPCLALVGTHPVTTAVAAFLAAANPLISIFSSGTDFKDFFNAVTIPMLVAGLIAGGAVYTQTADDPERRQVLKDTFSDIISSQASIIASNTGERGSATRKISNTSIRAAENTVVRSMGDELTESQLEQLRSSFDRAEENVARRLNQETPTETERIEKLSRSVTERAINSRTLVGIVPAFGMAMYTLSPFMGLLTGIFGLVVARLLSNS